MSGNWIVVVARNNLDLLQHAIRTFNSQDVPGGVRVLCVDNGSRADVGTWLRSRREITTLSFNPQHSVARAWNSALTYLFSLSGPRFVERVLVCNSDVALRPDTYRWLEHEQADFVTAVGVHTIAQLGAAPGHTPDPAATRPHPDFSCFMISRWCYAEVGAFDECFTPAWFEDNSYHVRMHRAGIRAYSIDLPFLHVGGGAQTLKRASETEQEELSRAFARNRKLFVEMYGCDPADTKAYEGLFK